MQGLVCLLHPPVPLHCQIQLGPIGGVQEGVVVVVEVVDGAQLTQRAGNGGAVVVVPLPAVVVVVLPAVVVVVLPDGVVP